MDFIKPILSARKSWLSKRILVLTILAAMVSATGLAAQQDDAVLATVDGQPITAGQINRQMTRTLGKIQLSPGRMTQAKSVSLEQRINQLVILDFLKQHKLVSSENEIRLEMDELKRKLATVEKSIDDYLGQTSQTQEDLQFKLAWQISWKRYLDQMLTDELLESHFQKNKRQFDGTELRVAHLLLKPTPTTDPTGSELQKKAAQIKSRIDSGALAWDEAVAQNSDAPTKNSGGEIGWIQLNGPMPQSFTTAAFKLSAREISEPVQTKFGIHIIRCIEVKPGKLGWRDRVEVVKKSATRKLFDAVAAKHRPTLAIEYSGQSAK